MYIYIIFLLLFDLMFTQLHEVSTFSNSILNVRNQALARLKK